MAAVTIDRDQQLHKIMITNENAYEIMQYREDISWGYATNPLSN